MMIESDLLIMSLCIFVPTLFALVLPFFPKGSEEYMRWWTLLGTAVTFVLSTFLFVDYLALLDQNSVVAANVRRPHTRTELPGRAKAANEAAQKNEPAKSDDLIARYP